MTKKKRLEKCIRLMTKYDLSPKFISVYTGIGLRTAQYWASGERMPNDEMLEKMEKIVTTIDREFKA